jgi:hypothetical protein
MGYARPTQTATPGSEVATAGDVGGADGAVTTARHHLRQERQVRTTPVTLAQPPGLAGELGRGPTIERLILHRLDNASGHLDLVDEEVVLDERGAAWFATYLNAAMQRADWRAAFQDAEGEVPTACRRLLAEGEFIPASRELALRLYAQMCARPNHISPGDFVVTLFRLPNRAEPHLALLKVDLDEERLVREFDRSGSHTRVRVRPAENLLPETKRLQKCALLRPSPDPAGFDVTLLDTQAGPRSDGVAAYFYRGFLTATLAPSARRHTRLFLSATETWIGQQAPRFSPPQLMGFYRARRAALARDTVSLAAFAEAALPDILPDARALRESLLAHLRAALFPSEVTDGPFAVDRATADPVVRTVTLELDGGARLRVDAALFEELVRVAERRTGEQKLQLVIESLTLHEVTTG